MEIRPDFCLISISLSVYLGQKKPRFLGNEIVYPTRKNSVSYKIALLNRH